jgi:hypothetical protein
VATQRLTVATLAGQSAVVVAAIFEKWRTVADPEAIDHLCVSIREHCLSPHVTYFAEWVDRWLMGDQVPGPGAVEGQRFQATCLSPDQAVEWADRCGNQFAEQGWLSSRLLEAASVNRDSGERYCVLIAREVFGSSVTDDELRAAAGSIPPWLIQFGRRGTHGVPLRQSGE